MSAALAWSVPLPAARYCPEPCGKRLFDSKRHAKEAHTRAGWRIRAYWCEVGHGWHVTNSEKKRGQW